MPGIPTDQVSREMSSSPFKDREVYIHLETRSYKKKTSRNRSTNSLDTGTIRKRIQNRSLQTAGRNKADLEMNKKRLPEMKNYNRLSENSTDRWNTNQT